VSRSLLLVGAAALAVASPAVAAKPPASLFVKNANLCRVVSLSTVRTAGGAQYTAGKFAGGTCTWETADSSSVVALSVHPANFMSLLGNYVKGGEARRVKVPGASSAVLLPLTTPHGYTLELYAGFPKGTVEVNVSEAAGQPPDSLAIAVLEAIVR
jgi:hypothetical protein